MEVFVLGFLAGYVVGIFLGKKIFTEEVLSDLINLPTPKREWDEKNQEWKRDEE